MPSAVATSPPPPPFQSFLDDHRSVVMAFLLATVGPVEADDCFQETFIAAMRAYPGLRDGRNLRGWVLTIANRKAIDALRARGRRPVTAADPPGGGAPDPGIERFSNGVGETWRAAATLPPRQRLAIAHRFAGDLPYRDIGRIMGCSEAAARRSVHDGLDKLRQEMKR